LIQATWGTHKPTQAVPIIIQAYDRQGLLNDVTRTLDQAKINILNARFHRNDDSSATLELTITINSTLQLSQVLGKISQISDIYDARRKH
jgi:GTP pyrophosphokinase